MTYLTSSLDAAPAMAAALMQQPLHHPLPGRIARQQQQNNGFPEFQPKAQMGDLVEDDRAHSLSAYLERAGKSGELPATRSAGARLHDLDDARARRQQQE
ncbi:MAG: hypothetical protein JWQ88_1846 [Rhodoferax sp.]|nr:hypothetical protein [Rhodoferax sp.]